MVLFAFNFNRKLQEHSVEGHRPLEIEDLDPFISRAFQKTGSHSPFVGQKSSRFPSYPSMGTTDLSASKRSAVVDMKGTQALIEKQIVSAQEEVESINRDIDIKKRFLIRTFLIFSCFSFISYSFLLEE
jgi:hypothetical protein